MGKPQRRAGKVFLATLFGLILLILAAGLVYGGHYLGYIPEGKGYGFMHAVDLFLNLLNPTSKPMYVCAVIVGVDIVSFVAVFIYACAKGKPGYFFPALFAAVAVACVPFEALLALSLVNNRVVDLISTAIIVGSVSLVFLAWVILVYAMKELVALFLLSGVYIAPVESKETPVEEAPVATEEEPVEEKKEEEKAPEEKEAEPVPEEKEEPAPVVEEPVKEEPAKEEPAEEEPAKEEPAEEELVKEEPKPAKGKKAAKKEVKEEPAEEVVPEEKVEEPAPVEEPVKEEPIPEEPKEEPAPEEAASEEEAPEADEGEAGTDLSGIQRKSFAEKLELADDELRSKYEELKAEAEAHGLKGRVSNAGDTYHLGRKNYLKITIVGKTLRVYYAINPKEYAGSPIPVEDVSAKKQYADLPTLLRIKSDLSLRRGKKILDDMMKGVKEEEAEENALDKAKKEASPKAVSEGKVLGKYEVFPEEDEFKYRLKANNGEVLIVSNGYTSRAGAKSGIETLRKNVAGGVIRVVTDKNGYSQFRIFTANESRLVVSGEFYKTKDRAESAVESVKRFYATEKVIDLEEIPAAERREWIYDVKKEEDKENGRLELFKDETGKWLARLHASNSEVLFVTANNYASKSGVVEAIENIKAAMAKPHAFRIIKDKQDRYQFVVESANGSILLLGETYASADSAKKAAVSVLSFIDKAEVIDTTIAPAEAE